MHPYIIPATILFWPIVIPYFTYLNLKALYYGFDSIEDMFDEEELLRKYSKYDKTCLIIDHYTLSTEILIKIIKEDDNRRRYHVDVVSSKTDAEKYLKNIRYDYIFFNDKIIEMSCHDSISKLIQIKDYDSVVNCKVHHILNTPIMNKFKVDYVFNN